MQSIIEAPFAPVVWWGAREKGVTARYKKKIIKKNSGALKRPFLSRVFTPRRGLYVCVCVCIPSLSPQRKKDEKNNNNNKKPLPTKKNHNNNNNNPPHTHGKGGTRERERDAPLFSLPPPPIPSRPASSDTSHKEKETPYPMHHTTPPSTTPATPRGVLITNKNRKERGCCRTGEGEGGGCNGGGHKNKQTRMGKKNRRVCNNRYHERNKHKQTKKSNNKHEEQPLPSPPTPNPPTPTHPKLGTSNACGTCGVEFPTRYRQHSEGFPSPIPPPYSLTPYFTPTSALHFFVCPDSPSLFG